MLSRWCGVRIANTIITLTIGYRLNVDGCVQMMGAMHHQMITVHGENEKMVSDGFVADGRRKMEWIVEAETLSDFIDHGRYAITSKPLIRCKDCLHFKHSDIRPNYCEVWDWQNTDKDYCSFAERRNDEQIR